MINPVFRTGENYYPQLFVEECKYVVKENKNPKYITDDIEMSSDSDRENSDEESFDEENQKNINITNTIFLIIFMYIYI